MEIFENFLGEIFKNFPGRHISLPRSLKAQLLGNRPRGSRLRAGGFRLISKFEIPSWTPPPFFEIIIISNSTPCVRAASLRVLVNAISAVQHGNPESPAARTHGVEFEIKNISKNGGGGRIEFENLIRIEILRPDFGSPSAYCLRAELSGERGRLVSRQGNFSKFPGMEISKNFLWR